jgi:K+/H+ antiporter YhaU regulatory subunit KhtT
VKKSEEVDSLPSVSADGRKLPMMTGFAVLVDRKLVPSGSKTIGQLDFMKESDTQVLFVDRRDRKKKPKDPIIRIPGSDTQVESGDWLYLGINQSRKIGRDRYGFAKANNEARSILKDGADVKYFPFWLTFDEIMMPQHAVGYALGSDSNARASAKGFLNMRARFNINVAGIVRKGEEEPLFFPGPEFIITDGDRGLLARFVEADGTSSASHEKSVLDQFTDKALFSKKMAEAL